MSDTLYVPDIGDFADVEVIETLVKAGDVVAVEQPLITLESDKATLEVPASAAGEIVEMLVKAGDKVSQGTPIARIKSAGKSPKAEAKKPAEKPAKAPPPAKSETKDGEEKTALVPDIGDFADVEIIEVLAKAGDVVAVEQPLITLESDKATLEVPSSVAGEVVEMLVKTGDKVSQGTPIARIKSAGDDAPAPAETAPAPAEATAPAAPAAPAPAAPAAPAPAAPAAPAKTAAPPLPPVVEDDGYAKPHAGPAVRRLAREFGVELAQVRGSGRKGRILKEDVAAHVKNALQQKGKPDGDGLAMPAMPDVDFRQFGEIEIHPLSRINKLSAANLRRNWLLAPHVTQMAEADVTDLEEFRKSLSAEAQKSNYKITPLAFFIKAAVAALREFPRFNASLTADGENLAVKKYYHIGVAVDTPAGLVVPVLRNADGKGVDELARELAQISQRARAGKLKKEEMQGGCFTISSLGSIGGGFFTPIINLPEVAILGVGRAEIRPTWNGKEFLPRRQLPLALSYDHRVIDGAAGARFITYYAALLADIRRLSL